MKSLILLILVFAIIGGVWGGVQWSLNKYRSMDKEIIHQIYYGREYFKAEEYEEFKMYLADHPEVEINDLDVLASDYPLITFRMKVPGNKSFPWGTVEYTYYDDKELACHGARVGGIIVGGIFALIILCITFEDVILGPG